jgi:DnaJ-class molecular chaperone
MDRFTDNNGLGMDETYPNELGDCKRCNGCGEVLVLDQWGDMDYIACPDCHGTGGQFDIKTKENK